MRGGLSDVQLHSRPEAWEVQLLQDLEDVPEPERADSRG